MPIPTIEQRVNDLKEAALRYNTGKPPLSFMLDFPNSMEQLSRVCDMGAKKYDLLNWTKGMPYRTMEDCLMRHLQKFHAGEDFDQESEFHHLAHVAWNALALLEYTYTHPEYDDRKGALNNDAS